MFLIGNVDMPDAGYGGAEPRDRRYGQAEMEPGAWVVGSGPEVAERLGWLQAELGIEHLTIFPQSPGMDRTVVVDQFERFARDMMPVLRARAKPIASASPGRIELAGMPLSAIEGHQAKTCESIGAPDR